MRRHVFILFMSLFLAACSGGSGRQVPTEISIFNLSKIGSGFAGYGNFRVYAIGPNGLHLGQDITSGKYDTELDTGFWRFYVVGWDNDNFAGTPLCGSTSFEIQPDGTTKQIAINLNNEKCSDPWFSPMEYKYHTDKLDADGNPVLDNNSNPIQEVHFQKMKLSFCDSKMDLYNLSDWNSECEVGAQSFRVGFINYAKKPIGPAGSGNVSWSSCIPVDPESPAYEFKLPLGDYGNTHIKYVVEGFALADCNKAGDFVKIPISQGMFAPNVVNNVRLFPAPDFNDIDTNASIYEKQFMSLNINIEFIEQIGLRMEPTRLSLGDRPIPSVFSRTVTLYNDRPGFNVDNCSLANFSQDIFSSPDFETNCSSIPDGGSCQFTIVADLNSVPSGVGIKTPIEINCPDGSLVKTGTDGFLVCPGGNCENGDFRSDLNIRYVPNFFGQIVVNEYADMQDSRDIEIYNDSDISYTNCQFSFVGSGASAFNDVSVVTNSACLNNIPPQSECRPTISPKPTQLGDQEASVVLSCDQDTIYYLENTARVTGVHPMQFGGAPLYGKFSQSADGKQAMIRFRNKSNNMLNNCFIQSSNTTDFELSENYPDGNSISMSCGVPSMTRSISMDSECEMGIIPKSGASGLISTNIEMYCGGQLVAEQVYSAERVNSGLGNIIVSQEASSFSPITIPYYGDGEQEFRWSLFRNNTDKNLYGCHLSLATSSSAAAANALAPSQHNMHCDSELSPGQACMFSFTPSRFPWDGPGALEVGNHSVSYQLVCHDNSVTPLNEISSANVNFNLSVNDTGASLRLSPSFHNFGYPENGDTVGPVTISMTNISGGELTGCQAPEFYINGNDSDPAISKLSISNNSCLGTLSTNDTCSFDISYNENEAAPPSMEAEMEIRCDFDKYVRTSSSFLAHFQSGGGSDDVNSQGIFAHQSYSQLNTGDEFIIAVYPDRAVSVDTSGGTPFMDVSLNSSILQLPYSANDSSENVMIFKTIITASEDHSSSVGSPTFNSNGAIFKNPQNGSTYSNFNPPNFNGLNTHLYINNTAPPVVVSMTSPTADGAYQSGDIIQIDVMFSEPVVVLDTYDVMQSGTVSISSGSTSVTGTSTYFFNSQPGDFVSIDNNLYEISSINSDTSMTLTTGALSTNSGISYFTKASPPDMGFEPLSSSNFHHHFQYDENLDVNDTDNIVSFRFNVPGGFTGTQSGLRYSDGYATNIFSVADNSIQAAFPGNENDIPQGNRIGDTTNFSFNSRPVITNIHSSCSSCTYLLGNTFTINVDFSESVDILDPSALSLHLKDDYGVDYFVTVDPASDNQTSSIWFNIEVPNNFYANDLDVFDIVGLTDQIRSVTGNNIPSAVIPQGTDDNRALAANHEIKLFPGAPYVINVTSSALDGNGNIYDLGQTINIDVTFSETVTVEAGDVANLSLNLNNDIGANVDINAISATATDNDQTITYEFNVPAGFKSEDLLINYASGIDSYVRSFKSGLLATTGGPVFPLGDANPNSLKSNKNIYIGNDPKVLSVSSPIADGVGNKITTNTDVDIQVNYNQNVNVTGVPRLRFRDNSNTFFFGDYLAGSGTSLLTYRVNVEPSLISTTDLKVDGFELNGGSIVSASNTLDYNEPFPIGSDSRSLQSNKNIHIGSNPTVVSITSNAPQGVANAISENDTGAAFKITVTFSEAVNILDGQEANVFLSFLKDDNVNYYNAVLDGTSDNNNNILVFDFVPPIGLTTKDLEIDTFHGVEDTSYIEAAASPGSYVVANSVPKYEGDANSLTSNGDIVIGDPPALNSFFVSAGPYVVNDLIYINLNFAKNINIDNPVNFNNLQLKILDADSNPVYAHLDPASINGDPTAIFVFNVPPNMNTADLTIVEAIGLEHLVDDRSTIPFNNSLLPVSGAAGSLSATHDIVVGGPAPNVVNMDTGTLDGTYYSGDNIQINVTFDLPVSVDGANANLVQLKLAGDNNVFAFAQLDNPCCNNNVTNLNFNFNIPYENFETADLQVEEVLGANFIVNAASGIPLDNASIDFSTGNPSSFVSNKNIQIASLPKIVSIAPLNGSFFQAPTQAGEELQIAVNFSGPVEIPANQGMVQLQLADQNSIYSMANLVIASLSDGDPNQIIFEASFDANFETNDLRVNSFYSLDEIKAAGTTQTVDMNFPMGNQAGSLQNDHNVVVSNHFEVINVTSDTDDSVVPFPNESLLVKVVFNAPVTIQPGFVMEPRLQAMGENGSIAIANIHEPSGYTNTDTLYFEFHFPQEFGANQLMISSAFDFYRIEKGTSGIAANIFDLPRNGGPNSLAANKNFVIEPKDPMTVYGSGVDGDLDFNQGSYVSLDNISDMVFDKDGQPKFASSFFKIRGIQYKTTPEPHHEISIDGQNSAEWRQFFQADGTPTTETTIERDDVLMWYVNSEYMNGCGAQLSPGMFGFFAAAEILTTTKGAFVAPPGNSLSIMGGAFLPTSGLPSSQNLFNRSGETDNSLDILPHCSMQLVRVLMPQTLRISSGTTLGNKFYNEFSETGGLLAIKVKDRLDLAGSNGAIEQIDMTGNGLAAVGYSGFNGLNGWHADQIPSDDQSGGVSESFNDLIGGGGAGYGAGGAHETSSMSGGRSPANQFCAGNCYSAGNNQVFHTFLGSAGAANAGNSSGGGVVILHAKNVENGTLNVQAAGNSIVGGGAGGGSVYLDFETLNPTNNPATDVHFTVNARGSNGVVENTLDSGGGGGGMAILNVCSNQNNGSITVNIDVNGGDSTNGVPGAIGYAHDGTNSGPECIATIPE